MLCLADHVNAPTLDRSMPTRVDHQVQYIVCFASRQPARSCHMENFTITCAFCRIKWVLANGKLLVVRLIILFIILLID
jgi:hypothetical protein